MTRDFAPLLVVGFVGRLVEQKGLGLLMPVVEALMDEEIGRASCRERVSLNV